MTRAVAVSFPHGLFDIDKSVVPAEGAGVHFDAFEHTDAAAVSDAEIGRAHV